MSFRLTDKGEDAATNPHARPGMDLKVVGFMYAMKKPVEIEEIMDETQISDEAAVNVMKRLINEGYVEEM
jgi:predicted transcriptional regulator